MWDCVTGSVLSLQANLSCLHFHLSLVFQQGLTLILTQYYDTHHDAQSHSVLAGFSHTQITTWSTGLIEPAKGSMLSCLAIIFTHGANLCNIDQPLHNQGSCWLYANKDDLGSRWKATHSVHQKINKRTECITMYFTQTILMEWLTFVETHWNCYRVLCVSGNSLQSVIIVIWLMFGVNPAIPPLNTHFSSWVPKTLFLQSFSPESGLMCCSPLVP